MVGVMTPPRFLSGPIGAARSDAAASVAKVLARHIGRPADGRATPGYSELLEASDAEFAWLPPSVYVRAEELPGMVLSTRKGTRSGWSGADGARAARRRACGS